MHPSALEIRPPHAASPAPPPALRPAAFSAPPAALRLRLLAGPRYASAVAALLWLGGAVGRRAPTDELLAVARAALAELRAEPHARAADAAIRNHGFGLRARGGYFRLQAFQAYALEQYQLERALRRALRALAARAPLRSAARAHFAARAAVEADSARQLERLACALGVTEAKLARCGAPLLKDWEGAARP